MLPILIFMLSTLTLAGNDDSGKRVELNGSASIEIGQIVKGRYLGSTIDHIWLSRQSVILGMDAYIKEKLKISLKLEGEYWYDTQPHEYMPSQMNPPFKKRPNIIIREAQGTYSFIDNYESKLKLSMGVFPIKINENARNLGEYLFRSRPYPNYVFTEFDFPAARLNGLNLFGSFLCGSISQNLLLYSEMDNQPLHDFSLAYVLRGNLKNVLKGGAGVSFYKLLPVNSKDEITPDSLTESAYLPEGSDSLAYYTFKGVMLDAFVSFDFKNLFRWDIFGENDMKLYAEVAVLGVKNYVNHDTTGNTGPNYYKDISNRIPITLGFNVPTFKIFEVLALEMELYQWDYPISFCRPTSNKGYYPIPVMSYDDKNDNIKWSVFMKYKIVEGWSIMAQFAFDHRPHRIASDFLHRDLEEIMNKKGHWAWNAKVQYEF